MRKYLCDFTLLLGLVFLLTSCSEWKVAPFIFNLKGPIVYCASSNSKVYALDANTGEKVWEFYTGQPINASPFFVDGVLYVVNQAGKVFALDANTGTQKWAFSTGVADGYGNRYSSPIVAEGLLYVGSTDKKMYALDADTGLKKWEYATGGEIKSSPLLYDGKVFFGSYDYSFYALDAKAGTKIWSVKTGNTIWSSPAVSAALGIVYVGSADQNLYAFNSGTGDKVWAFPAGGKVDSSPFVAPNGLVYVGSRSRDHKVYAVDLLSGQKKGEYGANDDYFSSPVVANGFVYIGNDDKRVYALNAAYLAEKKWEFSVG
ncbi:outer membrane protein assembly factor BamB family protein [Spirosoma pollinicola]|uniref:Pyrrolo-quinoline quinone n=1 Tax=Spirosoma pollinicola TaxID=2057025 RepID=A0A2K8Z1A5_9BACT|nr:PQQ-binding-like beta-propeller repeat protein [Spirosoma pollinicola]AUD03673.1 pyrrolo-quinoline quinone [Spirosoma pollinicola]